MDMLYMDESGNCVVDDGPAIDSGPGVGMNVRRYSTTLGWTYGSFVEDNGSGTTGFWDVGDSCNGGVTAGSDFATSRVLPPSVASSSFP